MVSKFSKFLNKAVLPVSKNETEQSKRRVGRPRKDPKDRHPRSKDIDKCDENGRLLPQYVKRKKQAGKKHYAARRARIKAQWKRDYARRKDSQRAWQKTLRRRYSQLRSVGRLAAKRKGMEPDSWFQLSYPEYLLMWASAPPVWDGNRFIPAKDLIGNPLLSDLHTYVDRLDRTKPYTRDNCRVFRGGKPL